MVPLMKLLIFSDSHGECSRMLEAVRAEQPDYVFHLGDHDRDAEDLSRDFPTLAVTAVRGNCDYWSDTPDTRLITLGGLRFFLCHGHTLGVKSGLLRASYAAMSKRADVLLFGHTHEPYLATRLGLTLMNPGACGFSYPSYGRILLEPGKAPDFQLIYPEMR